MIQIRRTDFLQGSTRLDLVDDAGRSLSHLDGIVPLTLHFGKDQAFVVDLPQATLAASSSARRVPPTSWIMMALG